MESRLILEPKPREIVFYRIMSFIGMIAFPAFSIVYLFVYPDQNRITILTILLPILYTLVFGFTFFERLKKYSYLLIVIIVSLTTLFFITTMRRLDFSTPMVYTLAICMATLVNLFKSERAMAIYLISSVVISLLTIVYYVQDLQFIILNMMIITIWPFLIFLMVKSKFETENELTKSNAFLKNIFAEAIDSTIIIEADTGIVLGCSKMTLNRLRMTDESQIIGKSIKWINEHHLNGSFNEDLIESAKVNDEMSVEVSINRFDSDRYYRIKLKRFTILDKDYALISFEDLTEELKYSEEIKRIAYIDELTSVANRRKAMNALDNLIEQSDETNDVFAILFIDLDYFKEINDTYGHDVGDEVLKIVAGRLKGSIDQKDLVARIGGDEFMIILKGLNDTKAVIKIINRIIASASKPMIVGDLELSMTISIGSSVYPIHGNNRHELMKKSDIALYNVKKEGRDGYKLYKC